MVPPMGCGVSDRSYSHTQAVDYDTVSVGALLTGW